MTKKMIKKEFQYKGQMINYYNKVKANDKIKMVVRYLDATKGYVVEYCYK